MGYRTTIQIILIAISVIIITTYIKPTFTTMKATQMQTDEYQKALDNAESFNAELQRLLNKANSYSTSEQRALDRYVPETVDSIAVMRDIETIVLKNGMQLTGLSSAFAVPDQPGQVVSAQGQSEVDTGALPVSVHSFTLSTAGTYNQFKSLLRDFERSAYPLEAANISFSPSDDQLYTFNLELETYSLISTDSNE